MSLLLLIVFVQGSAVGSPTGEEPVQALQARVGKRDSVMVVNCRDQVLRFAANTHQKRIPASIIKILTSLAALHYLGEDFHFATEIYGADQADIVLKGYGDPCFVSREIERAAEALSKKRAFVGDILVDDSFFSPAIQIPGRTRVSPEPYDAPNGALCANYNSIAVDRQNGQYVSAEPETPLLPFALQRLDRRPIVRGRVLLIRRQEEAALYAGELLAYFLNAHGCKVQGTVRRGRVAPREHSLLLRQASVYSLPRIIEKLLRYSNNFTANQLLLYCGAAVYGAPATLDKGVRAVRRYAQEVLGITDLELAEGSGLSRDNRISAVSMSRVLAVFLPRHELMRRRGNDFYKTGNLRGISTRAGFLKNSRQEMVSYVIMVNTPGKSADIFLPYIRRLIKIDGVKDE